MTTNVVRDTQVRVRVTYDLVMKESQLPTEHQLDVLAKRAHNFGHEVGLIEILDEEDVAASAAVPHFEVHVHNGADGYCEPCVAAAQDGLS